MLDTWSELSAPPPHTAPLEYVGELGTLHVLRDKGESGVTPIAIIIGPNKDDLRSGLDCVLIRFYIYNNQG